MRLRITAVSFSIGFYRKHWKFQKYWLTKWPEFLYGSRVIIMKFGHISISLLS